MAGHFGGVAGLEEELALEDFCGEEDGEGGPRGDEDGEEGEWDEGEAEGGDEAEGAELEAGGVLICGEVFFLCLAEDEELGDHFSENDEGEEDDV